MSAFSAAFGIGATVGPAFAAAVVALDPLAPLYAVAADAAGCAATVWTYLPERTPPNERKRTPRLSPLDRRIRRLFVYRLATGVAFFAALLVQRFNLPPKTLMRVGPILICVGHAIVALSTDLEPLVFGMLLSGLGGGMIGPGYVGAASLSVAADEQGSAAGLSNAAGASRFHLRAVHRQPLLFNRPERGFSRNGDARSLVRRLRVFRKEVRTRCAGAHPRRCRS